MKKKSSLSGLMAAAIAALGIAVLPACGDDAADKAAADKAASKPPVQQTTAAKEDKDTLAAARNQFAVKLAAGPLKQQVELCFFDTGSLTSCSDDQKGLGWDLKRAVDDTADQHIAGVSVKNGKITLTSRGISVSGKDSFSLILVPKLIKPKNEYESPISWELDPASTCLSAGLCDESFMKRW